MSLPFSVPLMTGLREDSSLRGEGKDGAAEIEAAPWVEIAEAISQEQLHLGRLELEMRRCCHPMALLQSKVSFVNDSTLVLSVLSLDNFTGQYNTPGACKLLHWKSACRQT